VLREIFNILKLNDNNEIDAISHAVEDASPIETVATDKRRKPPVKGTLLSYFDTSHPEKGSPRSELRGMNKRMVPSSASL
jgi:hypothetical protein